MTDRTVLKITGSDRVSFLQGLITNDIEKAENALIYAALLTPQGKCITDFFVTASNNAILIDVATSEAAALAQRLTMYKLRADVSVEATDLIVSRGTEAAPDGSHPDPRHDALGWRLISDNDQSDTTDWTALRIQHSIPETGAELIPNESYPLELGLDALHGIDFKKGCYVGQEVTARMKHKTDLRKGLARVQISTPTPAGSEITTEDGKAAGTLHSSSGNEALAYLRFDRADKPLRAGNATVTPL